MKLKLKFIILLIVCLFIQGCVSQKRQSYNDKLNYVKSNLEISNKEFRKIKKQDSIVEELSLCLKANIKKDKINRRLDSFFLNSYNTKDLISSLELDRMFPNMNIEIDRSIKKEDAPNFDNSEDLKKFIEERNKKIQKAKEEFNKKNRDSLN